MADRNSGEERSTDDRPCLPTVYHDRRNVGARAEQQEPCQPRLSRPARRLFGCEPHDERHARRRTDRRFEAAPVDAGLMMKVFYAFAALALLSVAISVGGKWYGDRSPWPATPTTPDPPRGRHRQQCDLALPANAIRFETRAPRRHRDRLDLYLRWPDMEGYTDAPRRLQPCRRDPQDHFRLARGTHDVARHERPVRADLLVPDRAARRSGRQRCHDVPLHRGVRLSRRGARRRRAAGQGALRRALPDGAEARRRGIARRPASATSISATISA